MSKASGKTLSGRVSPAVRASALALVVVAMSASAAFAQSPPTIAKSFSPSQIVVGGTSTITVTITNANPAVDLHGVSFVDTFPANLTFASPANLSSTCGGVAIAASAPPATLSLSGGTLLANTSCAVTASVTTSTAGVYVNTTGNVGSTEAGAGGTATASLDVSVPVPAANLWWLLTIVSALGAGGVLALRRRQRA